ncbi:probable helicase MAGATAMA 3 isoform X1 [Rhododendron vialii]|uniref:probable helicase MAGATAMA 3 isoform X1 n=1 Tax=Rhododendron vialii TaxID=182163 RepID=UPI00265F3AE8|nr:probable helicase MAGATAMA 3 isoform X1 [Rhododendron vialii]
MAVDKNKLEEEATILRFYKIVLSWDYLRLLTQSGKKNSKNIGDGSDLGLKHVKDTYKDVDEYLATFEPLLFEEVKAQILEGKDDEEKAEWKFVVPIKCSEADGFHLLTFILEDVESVKLNDLLLLSEKQFGDGTTKLPTKYAFGLVENRHDILGQVTVRLQLRGEVKQLNADDVEPCPRLLNMRSLVSEESKSKSLNILKICSLSTIVREYVALRSISSLPFKDLILAASERNYTSEDQAWEIPRPLMESIESNHNKSQLDAIRVGVSRKRLVLIQGPPGTGKTQTILGLLSAILHATPARVNSKGKLRGTKQGPEFPIQEKYNHWEKASPWLSGTNPRDAKMPENGDDGFFPTSGNELKPEVVNSSRKYRVRVLVCAPSNSALDEIVLRLLNTGIRDENNRAYNPKIVRIGLKPHHSVQTVSMDYLVEQKLAGVDFQTSDKHKHGGSGRERDSIRASILDEAAIVFSTLSFSGSVLFSKLNRGFDVVIIDEAAQAVEPATLVPLANGCKQLFLVGDPVQLPATVISPIAEKFGYGMSLFKRFQRAGYQVSMLKTQYRMHPEIRSFPSREFYDGELEDGPDVVNQTKRSWHDYRCFGPFCFFDIHEGKESQPSGSGSWVNEDEVDFVLAMYHKMVTRYPELKSSSRLAIISPYRHQVKIFRDRFRSTFGVESDKVVDINTVDGFQGREKDVAIFSCVRASKEKSIGFVADFRRMNVGITRARSSVLVVGSASTLKKDKHWQSLVESAEQRNSLFKVSKPYREFFSDENIKSMAVKVLMPEKTEAPSDEMEVQAAVPIYGNSGDMDQEPADDPYGDGDGDADGYDMGDGED